jgi:tetratricopeptide (TPR) repeat protein
VTLREWLAKLAAPGRPDANEAADLAGAGFEHERAGRHDMARACFRSAIDLDPDQPRSYLGLGRAARSCGDLEAAIESLRLALSLAPEDLEATQEMSLALQERGEHDQAETYARRALQLAPRSVEAHLRLADLLRRRGSLDEALGSCRAAVALAPQLPHAHNNLGNLYKDLGDTAQAIAAYRKALELDPGLAEAHFNLGLAVHESGDIAQAGAHYRSALEREPRLADAHLNLGFANEQLGDPQGAIRCYRAALGLRHDLAEAHFNLALQLLLTGDFAQGWEEYEWRWRLRQAAGASQDAMGPAWDGADPAGKTILLYAEQGFGDAIQFVRYALKLRERGAEVVLQCAPELKPLFAQMPGILAVLGYDEPPPRFDQCCPLLGLPRLFGTTLEGIPADIPYLRAEPRKIQRWRDTLALDAAVAHVGLVWAGRAASRTLRLEQLAPLGTIPRVVFHSLQKGSAADEAARTPHGMKLVDWSAQLRDFSDTAALIANLDLVVSVDTAVAHLAGAIGKPVWTLTPFPPEWRWLLDRTDSPWYPSMRLFRQRRLNDWTAVIAELAQALREAAPAR